MLRVLVVDDEPFVRQGVKVIIDWEKYGYKVVGEASNGLIALEMLKKEYYDLVLIDIKMPKINGLDFIGMVRRTISTKIKFIILSGFFEYEYAQLALKYQVTNYLLKPLQPEELIKSIQDIKIEIENQKRAEELERTSNKLMMEHYLKSVLMDKSTPFIYQELKKKFMKCSVYQYLYLEFSEDMVRINRTEERNPIKEQTKIYESLEKKYPSLMPYLVLNTLHSMKIFDIGIVLTDHFLKGMKMTKEAFMKDLKQVLEVSPYVVYISLGNEVTQMEQLRESYLLAISMESKKANEACNSLLQQIEREVQLNYYKDLTLKTLSEKYYINSAYLGQLFKREYGIFFKDYLNSVRIKKASKLLVDTTDKIYEIGKEVGYNNTDHFINTFTKEMGITPSRYRKEGRTSSYTCMRKVRYED